MDFPCHTHTHTHKAEIVGDELSRIMPLRDALWTLKLYLRSIPAVSAGLETILHCENTLGK